MLKKVFGGLFLCGAFAAIVRLVLWPNSYAVVPVIDPPYGPETYRYRVSEFWGFKSREYSARMGPKGPEWYDPDARQWRGVKPEAWHRAE